MSRSLRFENKDCLVLEGIKFEKRTMEVTRGNRTLWVISILVADIF